MEITVLSCLVYVALLALLPGPGVQTTTFPVLCALQGLVLNSVQKHGRLEGFCCFSVGFIIHNLYFFFLMHSFGLQKPLLFSPLLFPVGSRFLRHSFKKFSSRSYSHIRHSPSLNVKKKLSPPCPQPKNSPSRFELPSISITGVVANQWCLAKINWNCSIYKNCSFFFYQWHAHIKNAKSKKQNKK